MPGLTFESGCGRELVLSYCRLIAGTFQSEESAMFALLWFQKCDNICFGVNRNFYLG